MCSRAAEPARRDRVPEDARGQTCHDAPSPVPRSSSTSSRSASPAGSPVKSPPMPNSPTPLEDQIRTRRVGSSVPDLPHSVHRGRRHRPDIGRVGARVRRGLAKAPAVIKDRVARVARVHRLTTNRDWRPEPRSPRSRYLFDQGPLDAHRRRDPQPDVALRKILDLYVACVR